MNEQNKPTSEAPTITLRKRNTTYVIGLNFSKTSRENYADKANRLIRNDVKAGNFWAELKPNFSILAATAPIKNCIVISIDKRQYRGRVRERTSEKRLQAENPEHH